MGRQALPDRRSACEGTLIVIGLGGELGGAVAGRGRAQTRPVLFPKESMSRACSAGVG
jgi:hypothetical protein